MTALRPATSPPPVRMPMRFFAIPNLPALAGHECTAQRSLLGRFRLALLAPPKTLQRCGHGVAEAPILQLGIGQHRSGPSLAVHLGGVLPAGPSQSTSPTRPMRHLALGAGCAGATALLIGTKTSDVS